MPTYISGRKGRILPAHSVTTTSPCYMFCNCTVARDLQRYNIRQDAVLQEIAVAIRSYIPTTSVLTADIGEGYAFPLHIVPSDLRPDIVWWDENSRSLRLAELTVCFESNFEDAALRKSAKYLDLADQADLNGYHTTLLTLQVGSRGVPDYASFSCLATLLDKSARDLSKPLEQLLWGPSPSGAQETECPKYMYVI